MDHQIEQKDQNSATDKKHILVDPESGQLIEVNEDETKWAKENEYLDLIKQLKNDLAKKNNECESLRIKLDESARVVNCINQELNKCKFTVFEMNQDSVRNKEKSAKLKNLEERYAKLTNDFIVMGEEYEQFKAKLFDRYLAKTNAINNMECLQINQIEESSKIKQELHEKMAQLKLIEAQIKSLTVENSNKDKIISTFKQSIQELQSVHRNEIEDLNRRLKDLTNETCSLKTTQTSSVVEEPVMQHDSPEGKPEENRLENDD